MSNSDDGRFTGKSWVQVDSSNELSQQVSYMRPSFDGFTAANESGSASGSVTAFPGGGSRVIAGDIGMQSPNDYTGFDTDKSRTKGYGAPSDGGNVAVVADAIEASNG